MKVKEAMEAEEVREAEEPREVEWLACKRGEFCERNMGKVSMELNYCQGTVLWFYHSN